MSKFLNFGDSNIHRLQSTKTENKANYFTTAANDNNSSLNKQVMDRCHRLAATAQGLPTMSDHCRILILWFAATAPNLLAAKKFLFRSGLYRYNDETMGKSLQSTMLPNRARGSASRGTTIGIAVAPTSKHHQTNHHNSLLTTQKTVVTYDLPPSIC